jgi:two-component system, response regulator PdtaR
MARVPVAETPPVVLVVEDEELLRLCAADLLEDAGFEVIEASDAKAALKIMESRPEVRVLFTDIQMPGIAATGHSDRDIVRRTFRPVGQR